MRVREIARPVDVGRHVWIYVSPTDISSCVYFVIEQIYLQISVVFSRNWCIVVTLTVWLNPAQLPVELIWVDLDEALWSKLFRQVFFVVIYYKTKGMWMLFQGCVPLVLMFDLAEETKVCQGTMLYHLFVIEVKVLEIFAQGHVAQ